MSRLKIAIRLESLGLHFRKALQEAARLNVSGVQLDAVGDFAPRSLSQTGRREFRHLLRSHNVELSALGCPLRHGLDVAQAQEARIDHIKNVMTLSFDLGARIVVTQVGAVPEDEKDPRHGLLHEALLALALHGDRGGAVLAMRTGLEPALVLEKFLARFDTAGIGVTHDPGAMLMAGHDPYESARVLRQRAAYVYATDARKVSVGRTAQETPLGTGDLDWMQYLSVLEEIEYHGWLTVVGENPGAGVGMLRRLGV
jgi:sugar phosphate isomerase/epimerase